ncbi:MAG: hypothetical protein AVDCRST_MAG48-2752, partial [uncultured Friedmanniella sp.]
GLPTRPRPDRPRPGVRLGLPPAAGAGLQRRAGDGRPRRGGDLRDLDELAGAGDLAPADLLPAAERVQRGRAGAGARQLVLRVEGRGVLPRPRRRHHRAAAGRLVLPAAEPPLRRAPRPRGALPRDGGPLPGGRGEGRAPARRLLRRLDHLDRRRAVQGRPGQQRLV